MVVMAAVTVVVMAAVTVVVMVAVTVVVMAAVTVMTVHRSKPDRRLLNFITQNVALGSHLPVTVAKISMFQLAL